MVPSNNNAEIKLETALAKLWERSRFTSYFYQSVDLIETTEIPTITLIIFRSRLALYYAESFIQKQTIEEIIGLLVHEMLHVMMNHNHRAFPDEDIRLQNLAQDMVINSHIKNNRKTYFSRKGQYKEDVAVVDLPRGLPTIPEEFTAETAQTDPAWEELYRWLARLSPDQQKEIVGPTITDNSTHTLLSDDEQDALNHLNEDPVNPLNIPDRFKADESFIMLGDQQGMTFLDDKGRYLATGVHMMMPPKRLSTNQG